MPHQIEEANDPVYQVEHVVSHQAGQFLACSLQLHQARVGRFRVFGYLVGSLHFTLVS